MLPKADIIIREVNPPADNWCQSGHYSTGTFKRAGPDSEPEPIRFFRFTGLGFDGVYCEPCLVIMHHMAKLKKKGIQ
jgi:hypothetical protein